MSSATGSAATAQAECTRPMREHDHHERDRVQAAADQRPADLAERDVARAHRRGQRGVVELRVLQPEEHVEGGVEDRAVHRRGGQQRRGHEAGEPHRLAARAGHGADQLAQADPDGQQVEQRLEHPGDQDQPGVPVDPRVPLDQVRAAAAAQRGPAGAQQRQRQHPQRKLAQRRRGHRNPALDIQPPPVGPVADRDAHGGQHGQVAHVHAAPRAAVAVPRLSARHSATPCHSGVT